MLDVMALLQIQWDALCIEENPLEKLDLNLSLASNTISDKCVCDELFSSLNHSALFVCFILFVLEKFFNENISTPSINLINYRVYEYRGCFAYIL